MGTSTSQFPIGASITLDHLSGNVHPYLAHLRAEEPVSWLPALGGWLVTTRSLAIEVLRDVQKYTVDDPRFSTAQVLGPSMLSTDGEEHLRHRAPFIPPFQQTAVRNDFEDWTTSEAHRMVETLLTGPCAWADLRAGLAGPLAVAVIARALGLLNADPDRILDWYRSIAIGIEGVNAGQIAGEDTRLAVAELRREVDRTVRNSAGSMLAGVAKDGSLSAAELFSNTAVLMFGAIETSEGMTSNALFQLLTNPAQITALTEKRGLVANAVEESLRMEPAATLVDRYATRDVVLDGVAIAAGDLVTVSLAGANRDPSVFTDPDRYDAHRTNAHLQLAFVKGPHVCLGLHLARLQTIAAVNAVLDLMPDVMLDSSQSQEGFESARGLVFRKPQRIPVRWSPN